MAKKKSSLAKTMFFCQECGESSPKWLGKCHQCGAWNSFVEEKIVETSTEIGGVSARASFSEDAARISNLFSENETSSQNKLRTSSGFKEVDRVLGGGFFSGSLILVGGEPGIGKSTLLLQVVGALASKGSRCLYISGEESKSQVAARARRLGVSESNEIGFLSTSSLESALEMANEYKPNFLIVDSVQTLESDQFDSVAGTVSQIREVTHSLMKFSKSKSITTILVGHVTKEGSIAGPKLLEHMVDAVFYFEQATSGGYRLLRGQKNRFGPTSEIAVLEMSGKGLVEVDNPSERFLAERSKEMPGSAIVAHLEGTRPFLTEVQALTSRCFHGYPRRTVQGVDQNRVSVLMAVAEKALKLNFSDQDVYFKVASGARIVEPAADLAILFALVSALKNQALPPDMLFVGEVGLGGEVRSTTGVESRLKEARNVGLARAVVPKWNLKEAKHVEGVSVIAISSVSELATILGQSDLGL